jgi:hypothetical protein
MWHSIGRTAVVQFQSLLRGFLQDGSCPFSTVLTVKDIVDLMRQECVETYDRIFTPVGGSWRGARCTTKRRICWPRCWRAKPIRLPIPPAGASPASIVG